VTARPGHHAEAPEAERRRAHTVKILPDDPLVRWLVLLMVFVSVGAPGLAALVLLITQ
jgi:hypothetical protein